MKGLVIGGSGFVARHLVPELHRRGIEAVVAARGRIEGASTSTCDVRDGESTRRLLQQVRPAFVVNLAATSRGPADAMCQTNVIGTYNLLAASRLLDPKPRAILFGSAAEYGRSDGRGHALDETAPCEPVGAYGITKLTATRLALTLAEEWGLPVTVVRPFNIVGAGGPEYLLAGAAIARLIARIEQGSRYEIAVGRTDTARDFVAVEDVVDGIVGLITHPETGGVFNICSGRPVLVSELLDVVARVSGLDVSWNTDPALIRGDDPLVSFGTARKLKDQTGFEPRVSLETAVAAAWEDAIARRRATELRQ